MTTYGRLHLRSTVGFILASHERTLKVLEMEASELGVFPMKTGYPQGYLRSAFSSPLQACRKRQFIRALSSGLIDLSSHKPTAYRKY